MMRGTNCRSLRHLGSAFGKTRKAALIATFYGPRDDQPIQKLYDKLYQRLELEPGERSDPDTGENRKNKLEEKYGHRFDPPGRAAVDTTVVQIALNAPGSAADAWNTMRQDLDDILQVKDLNGLWGYTLVYQAVSRRGADVDVALQKSLWATRQLRTSETESMQQLAAVDVAGGRVWLLGIPEMDDSEVGDDSEAGDALKAGTVYCALGPSRGEKTLLEVFYGRAAKLLTPDLIAHKGYYQMRQYRGEDLERGYEERVQRLRLSTDKLLQGMEHGQVRSSLLNKLSENYYHMVPVVSRLDELHIGIQRQLKNYDQWQKSALDNDIVDFHGEQLGAAVDELDLMVKPLKDALDRADKAVSLAQVQENKKHEELLADFTLILASVTSVLATVEIIVWHIKESLEPPLLCHYLSVSALCDNAWAKNWASVPRIAALITVVVLCLVIIFWQLYKRHRRQ